MQAAYVKFGKIEVQFFLRKMNFSPSELAWATCTKHPTHVICIMRVACDLLACTYITDDGAEGAWHWRAVCRWPTLLSENLKFDISQKIELQLFQNWFQPPAHGEPLTTYVYCITHRLC